jgi:membrane fusion protein (multidrug efflux system)
MRIAIIVALLSAIAILSGCSGSEGRAEISEIPRGIAVQTISLKPRAFSEYLELTGTVEARNQIQIIAEEGGLLKRILKDKGNYENAGDTLAILENKVLESGYREARASLNQARLNFKSSEVLYEKKAISENEYLTAKYALERAQAVYELAEARYSKLFLKSPICALVNERYYDFGAYVMPMTPVFEVIDNEVVRITAGVAERFLANISVGTPVESYFDAFPDMVMNSTVSFVSKSVDPASRTFRIEIEIKNPDRKLVPQMVANLKILKRSFENEIVVPIDALMSSENGRYVFVHEDTLARQVEVDVLAVHEDSVLVRGLTEDQQLVVMGQQDITNGERIYTLEAQQ